MPAPATVTELLELIQKSGVTDEARLRAYVLKLNESGTVPSDPGKLAGQLVRDGLLTYFQAEQLLQGKWKRFHIGKYKVLERIGSGGMGQVFLCEHKLMRRRVAVKVLPTTKAQDPSSQARFYREARAVAALDHPNIVRAYDIDQDENLHFLVMEYVDGTNLQDLVKKFGPLDVPRACHYVYGAAVGLQHAHEVAGLVHRDIKPGNILVDRSGVVKILDMGLARFYHDEEDNLTRKNEENVLGTADYLAPEQAIDSHAVDIRADVYSLGATFYFLLTGTQPFPEGSIAQKLIWHQHREPRPVRALRPDAPDGVVTIVERMMAKRPEDRYQTPAEVIAALVPWVATPIPPPSDKELPQLSPAAMTTAAGTGLRSAIPTSGQPLPASSATVSSSLPTIAAQPGGRAGPGRSAVATPPPAPALSNPGAAVNGPGVWADIASDTQSVTQSDTRPPGAPAPADDRPALAPTTGRGLLIAAGLCVLLAAAAAVAAYVVLTDKKPPRTDGGGAAPPPVGPRRLVVSKAGGEHTVPTLREALARVAPGETVVIADERLAEPPIRVEAARHLRDVTIESGLPGGRAAVVECSLATSGPAMVPMLAVDAAENVRIRNVEFDGRGAADVGLQFTGGGHGVVFEGVTVRNVKGSGFRLVNAAGDPTRPLALDRCRVILGPTTDAGVLLTATGPLLTRDVVIRGCRFEGPGISGIRFDGPTAAVEVIGNRFYKLAAGVSFARPPAGKQVKGQLYRNTFYETTAGLRFDFRPAEVKGGFDLAVRWNYFARTPAIARTDGPGSAPVPGAHFRDNGHDGESKRGNAPAGGVTRADGPELPDPNPNDPGFLKFPGEPPTVGPSKVTVGADAVADRRGEAGGP